MSSLTVCHQCQSVWWFGLSSSLCIEVDRVVLWLSIDVLLEDERVLPCRTDEAHVLELADSLVEVDGDTMSEMILTWAVLVVTLFAMNGHKQVEKLDDVNVLSKVHHQFH